MQTDVLICGGGASGLAAAIVIGQICPTLRVSIAERNPRVGKKLLVTGNGRCNLGNATGHSHSYYGTVAPLVAQVFSQTTDTSTFFAQMGLYCRQDSAGRCYPHSNQAASVLDALRFRAQELGVEICCDCTVTGLQREDAAFHVETSDGEIAAQAVIVTAGGLAAPKTGSDGTTIAFLQQLGIPCTPLRPALTSFQVQTPWMPQLKGIRVAAQVTACDANGRPLAIQQGEVQFMQQGLSGICIMNLSAICTSTEPAYLSLQLLPGKRPEQILELLWKVYGARAQWSCEDFLTGLFPKKIGHVLLRQCAPHLPLTEPVYRITPTELELLAQTCQDWRFPIVGRGDWNQAQVTAGGISMDAIEEDLQARQFPGLFFAGEILDIHGICGGYNLDWAWRSGQYAAQSTIRYLAQQGSGEGEGRI